MKQRCSNPKRKSYKDYGARGITVCEEWKNSFKSFYDFAVVNGWRKDLQTDRIDNNKGYSPDNVRFVTSFENRINSRWQERRSLPVGVRKDNKKYTPVLWVTELNKNFCIGCYKSPEEAKQVYEFAKDFIRNKLPIILQEKLFDINT